MPRLDFQGTFLESRHTTTIIFQCYPTFRFILGMSYHEFSSTSLSKQGLCVENKGYLFSSVELNIGQYKLHQLHSRSPSLSLLPTFSDMDSQEKDLIPSFIFDSPLLLEILLKNFLYPLLIKNLLHSLSSLINSKSNLLRVFDLIRLFGTL